MNKTPPLRNKEKIEKTETPKSNNDFDVFIDLSVSSQILKNLETKSESTAKKLVVIGFCFSFQFNLTRKILKIAGIEPTFGDLMGLIALLILNAQKVPGSDEQAILQFKKFTDGLDA